MSRAVFFFINIPMQAVRILNSSLYIKILITTGRKLIRSIGMPFLFLLVLLALPGAFTCYIAKTFRCGVLFLMPGIQITMELTLSHPSMS